ncbi:hypothetical protein RND71_043445 [Anisodus tanguticus]|uniref:AMP-dependent synthetase/ligase domain-containing protein n=1 Tax=Anisodus tanguticus TaxID=243964 RepID=A0AAE1UTL4_9SOLA|nr:hypothetical protein RND71_043445 [Anisodus tanguticus]
MIEYGFQPGEEIALMMNNRPEFIGIWLGLSKAGLVTAFINTSLREKSLIHSISVVNCKAVIFDHENLDGGALVNVDNKEGSCGFMSLIIPTIYPVCLIKLDENTNEPIRDENGLCVHCTAGESGEFVGKIITTDITRSFDGYLNKDATKRKIIRNVFTKGDQAFLSGDLLTMDEFGYLYFKDRTGDTFRWKGENVSTAEVESVISNILKQRDSVVFGIEIKDCEGKAGMVAIQSNDEKIDLDMLLEKMQKMLPRFAIPIFIRLTKNFEMTDSSFGIEPNNVALQNNEGAAGDEQCSTDYLLIPGGSVNGDSPTKDR